MRSQHKQNRRPRGNKPQDDDQYISSRMDESSDSYSRSHRASHQSEHRRASSASDREYYDGYRDMGSHSRSRHDEEAWYSDAGRYREEDVYRREDEYEAGMRRDSDWGTRPAGGSQYPTTRDDWSHQHYDHPSSYHDPTSWGGSAPRDAYDSNNTYYDDWSTPDAHGSSSHVHDEDRRVHNGEKPDRDDLSWHRDHRREKGAHQRRHQSGSGWDAPRRENGWEDRVSDDPHAMEERAWEPAPSWKPSHREGAQNRNQHNQRSTQSKQYHYSKGGKRSQNAKQQRRDWRNDDSNLNNWTRRDLHSQSRKVNKSQHQHQHQHQQHQQRQKEYRSRSRSRSPADSYHSRLSSRGRSRSHSHSPAPKRRRRESSPVTQRSRTPSERDAPSWIPRQGRDMYPRSPSPRPEPKYQHSRRKSISSVSTATTDRSSRSASPHTKARPVHRLPPASESPTPMSLDNMPHNTQHSNPRHQSTSQSNGKYRSHGSRHEKVANTEWPPDNPSLDARYTDPMPPPSIIPPPRSAYGASESLTPEKPPSPRVNISSRPNRNKSFGFKPIARPQPPSSSSLRKFFPGDDEELDQPDEAPLPSHRTQVYRPPHRQSPPLSKAVWPPEDEQETQETSWSTREPPQYGLPEPNHSDKHRSPPQPLYEDTNWNEGTSRQPFIAPAMVSDGKLGQPPNETVLEERAQHSQQSPASHQGLSSPALLPPPPPPMPPPQPPMGPDRHGSQGPSHTVSTSTTKDLYTIITQVGEGTFGKVYKARNSLSSLLVALKRIRMETEKDGFPVTAMREIKLLQSLRHENIVQLYEMMVSNGSVYMVFEYMDHDLTGILSQTQFEFAPAHLKSLCHQMLAGLAYLHHKGVIHRDIKGSNILINNRGELKLADFGLARFYQKRRSTDYTNRVITLWYRPPELLFGATVYGPEVDMWSAGCIMLELFTKKPIFQGNDEIHQLDVIHKILGTPTPERWTGLVDLPWYELAKPRDQISNRFRDIFQKWMSPAALDLAEQLLAYDPARRISAVQAMEAPYFTQEAPGASLPTGLASLEGEWHELETKRERAKKRKKNESGA